MAVLKVQDLSIRVDKRLLMQNVSFNLEEGDVILLSGENGIGKSTLIKTILRLEAEGKSLEGSIHVNGYGDVLSLNPDGLQKLRSTVAYIQQRDDYSAMGNIQVRDILSESADAHGRKALTSAEVNDLIDEWIPRRSDNSRVFDAKSKPARFSGGEQRLLSILSVIATRHDAELMLIDEPLNNLDYVNARNISNMINRAIKENPRMGILMVSHCRIFPFITREIKLTSDGAYAVPGQYVCHSCFGEADGDGYFVH